MSTDSEASKAATPEAPVTGRIDLGDGDWIEITDNPTHDRVATWYEGVSRKLEDPATYLDLVRTTIYAFGTAWSVKGDDGHELPFTLEEMGRAPFKKTMAAFRAAEGVSRALREALSPNA